MLNLMKFWLRYLRLKKAEIFQKLFSSSSFSMSIISVNSSVNSNIRDIFEICLFVEIDEELTEIFKIKGKAQLPKSQ